MMSLASSARFLHGSWLCLSPQWYLEDCRKQVTPRRRTSWRVHPHVIGGRGKAAGGGAGNPQTLSRTPAPVTSSAKATTPVLAGHDPPCLECPPLPCELSKLSRRHSLLTAIPASQSCRHLRSSALLSQEQLMSVMPCKAPLPLPAVCTGKVLSRGLLALS
jgi:hypothetical protein